MPRRRRFSAEPFGATVSRLMATSGTTYRDLAAKSGLSASYLNRIVHGDRPLPDDDVLENIARALNVEPDHFREYRLRILTERLEAMPETADRLYEKLIPTA
jgi:transcriptional regulator with XRE-family HTH domain